MNIDLKYLTISKANKDFKSGIYKPIDLVNKYLENINELNPKINAFIEIFDDINDQVKIADEMFKSGKDTLLTGIPVAIKDNILFRDHISSSASKYLEKYKAVYDSTVVRKLKEAGAIILGRTNMDEFAMGGSTENSAYGVTRNPLDQSRVAGGTSGGSAAAVAAHFVLVALGSDTGGSIRQPSSFCGVVGLKPTYGSVSRYGLMAAVSSFDQIGPIAKNIEDTEIVYDFIKGEDAKDSTTLSPNLNDSKKSEENFKKVIGYPKHLIESDGVNVEIKNNFKDFLNKMESKGYEIREINLANASLALPVYYILNFAEISSNMSRYDGMRFGKRGDGKDGIDDYFVTRGDYLGKEVKRRILLGTYVLSSGYYDAYYNKANFLRETLKKDYKEAFKDVSIIATPTTPSPAFEIGDKNKDPLSMYLEDIFTVTANLTGMPAISIPSGKINNLPLGIQITADTGNEKSLFKVGKDFLGEI